MSCDERQTYVSRATANIEDVLSEALDDIRTTFNTSADFVVQQPGLFGYSDYGLPMYLYAGTTRVKEFDPFLFDTRFGDGFRGNYHPLSGRIFLRQGTWCRHCLIHETLHSVSVFASQHNIHIGRRYLFLREGLTEFLTGFVLWSQHRHCYESWKTKLFPSWCALSPDYEEMARIWYTFCCFISFENVKSLFFGNGLTNWGNLWSRFLAQIHHEGYNSFQDPMLGSIARFQDRFLEQCKANFGRVCVERIHEVESPNFAYESI